jgi:peptidoglycan/xylan/chitin deacetylase (PgdA/CDA1 family)
MPSVATALTAMACLIQGDCIVSGSESVPIETRIAPWQGDCAGAFMLLYDDGCVSNIDNAVPALCRRNLPGTFYIIPEAPWFKDREKDWTNAVVAHPNICLGNHTYTHTGIEKPDESEFEFKLSTEKIYRMKGLPEGTLLSYAAPGGVKWNISREQEDVFLNRYRLIRRPDASGHVAARTHKTARDVFALLDSAEKNGTAEHLVFHGIGGDWFNFENDEHDKLLDELIRRKGRIWTGSAIAIYKYEQERGHAHIATSAAKGNIITVAMVVDTDPAWFDEPLTLVTRVPSGWTNARIIQGDLAMNAVVKDGHLVYNVNPVSGVVILTRQ